MNANLVRLTLFLGTAASFVVFQQAIPIRQVTVEATSVATVGLRARAFEMSDGRVLVNDMTFMNPKLLMMDSKLATSTTVADSTTLTKGQIRNYVFNVVPFRADTTLLADPNGVTLIVLDPNGKNVSVMTMPTPREVTSMSSGSPAFDSKLRLVYRGAFPRPPRPPSVPGQAQTISSAPVDSFPLVRADFEARTTDTAATLHVASGTNLISTLLPGGNFSDRMIRQPLPLADDWAVLSDGSIAIVRGHDYHVDWIYADGTRASTPKLPFDWRRLTLEDKQHIVDSFADLDAKARARSDSVYAARGQKTPSYLPTTENVPASALPDYYPPVRTGTVAGDRDGYLWILPTTSSQAIGGLLYDVVNRKGELFERVQLPRNCALAGFGLKRAVYVYCTEKKSATDTTTIAHLKRLRVAGARSQHH